DAGTAVDAADDLDPLAGVALQAGVELPAAALRLLAGHPDRVQVVLDDPVGAVTLALGGKIAVEVPSTELSDHAHELAVAFLRSPGELLEPHRRGIDRLARVLLARAQGAPELDPP